MSKLGARAQQRYFDLKAAGREELLGQGIETLPNRRGHMTSRPRAQDDSKVLNAIEVMSRSLLSQQLNPLPIRSSPFRITAFDESCSCGSHPDCRLHKSSCRTQVALIFPFCWSRRYISKGEIYFMVFSCVSETSPSLGRGHTECAAWDVALGRLPVLNTSSHSNSPA